ncbi:MAG: hypothetical protein Q8P45_02780 [Candidatus Harrisonbacteria bacterium]|nr:hypothetical protein [Candidatus Harrisonbacteria bacterium]
MNPYIGICDVASAQQARLLAEQFAGYKKYFSALRERRLMLGLMMSYKTLNGLETKWAKVFPPKEKIAGIFIKHPEVVNTLHYADYDGISVEKSLKEAAHWGGPHLQAIQLDMIWPEASAIQLLLRKNDIKVVLQVSGRALDAIEGDRQTLIRRLKQYQDLVSVVLFDKSMGRGLGLDAEGLRPFIRALVDSNLGMKVAVAGGLGPESLNLVRPLVKEFPDLSIDAQGRLRLTGSAMDPINEDLAVLYLKRAVELFAPFA